MATRSSSHQRKGRAIAAPRRMRPLTIAIPLLALVVVVLIVLNNRASAPANGARPIAQLDTQDFHALAFSQTDPNTVFFGHHDGVLVSRDQGETWQPSSLQGADAMSLATSANNPQRMYAAGHGIFYRSSDGGATWDKVNSPIQGADIHGFAASPDNADRIYALVVGQGMLTSTDGGDTWQPLSSAPSDFTAIAAGPNQTLYVGNSIGSIFESRDGGQTWQQSSLGAGTQVTSLTFDKRSNTLYAAAVMSGMTMSSVARRAADGGAWETTPFRGTGPILVLSVSPHDQTVLALNQRGEVYRSRDGGATWSDGT